MSYTNPSISVQVDVTNPGQYFACCGLLELAHRLWPGAEGWFDGIQFHLVLPDQVQNPLDVIIKEISESNIQIDNSRGDKATYPVLLENFNITLDWWIDRNSQKTPLKLWAGQLTSLHIVNKLHASLIEFNSNYFLKPFSFVIPLTSRFGVDPRAAWNALDVGFSPNEQSMIVATFPIVELFAAIGLQGFSPIRIKNLFLYSVWNIPLPTTVARIASNGVLPTGTVKTYSFSITTRGSNKGFDFAKLYQGEET